jgi:hypothetical protein
MSKLGCTCGHTIRDQTDCIPYKALCYSDEDTPVYFEAIETITDLIQAREDHMIEQSFSPQSEQQRRKERMNLTREITRILGYYRGGHLRDVFECENCGRLWLQVNPRENTFVSYLPEGHTRGVFRSHGGREEIPKITLEKALQISLNNMLDVSKNKE